VICEVIPEKPENLIYDTTMYLASVTVTSRLEGSQEILTVSPVTYTHLDAKGAEIGKPGTAEPVFNNLKMPDIPKTGDDTNLAQLTALMLVSGLLAFVLRRRKRA